MLGPVPFMAAIVTFDFTLTREPLLMLTRILLLVPVTNIGNVMLILVDMRLVPSVRTRLECGLGMDAMSWCRRGSLPQAVATFGSIASAADTHGVFGEAQVAPAAAKNLTVLAFRLWGLQSSVLWFLNGMRKLILVAGRPITITFVESRCPKRSDLVRLAA